MMNEHPNPQSLTKTLLLTGDNPDRILQQEIAKSLDTIERRLGRQLSLDESAYVMNRLSKAWNK